MISPSRLSELVAVIEVDGTAAVEVPRELIRQAYCASRFGLIGLLLRGTSPQAMDRILDPFVAAHGTGVCGVRYFAVDDGDGIAAIASTARFAVASSNAFRACIARLGIPMVRPDELQQSLASEIDQASQRI